MKALGKVRMWRKARKILAIMLVMLFLLGMTSSIFAEEIINSIDYSAITTGWDAAEQVTRTIVSTEEELDSFIKNTINNENNGAEAKYEIYLKSDIPVSIPTDGDSHRILDFKRGNTTIYGCGFTIYPKIEDSGDCMIVVDNGAILNFGSDDNELKQSTQNKLFINKDKETNNQTFIQTLLLVKNGTVNIYDGVVFQNNKGKGSGGAAIKIGDQNEGTPIVNMFGGEIKDCATGTDSRGGAILIDGASSVFNMSDGIIHSNTVEVPASRNFDYTGGGGVYINKGTFNMSGGEISNNTTSMSTYEYRNAIGGGVANVSGTFEMSGGVIQKNVASNNGGGVTLITLQNESKNSTFTMTGGIIQDNKVTAESSIGGGVNNYNGIFTMEQGTYTNPVIQNNQAYKQGDDYSSGTSATSKIGVDATYENNFGILTKVDNRVNTASAGKQITGWYKDNFKNTWDGLYRWSQEDKYTKIDISDLAESSGNLFLKAAFAQNVVQITLDLDGGTSSSLNGFNKVGGETNKYFVQGTKGSTSIPSKPADPKKVGWTFKNWYTVDSDGNTTENVYSEFSNTLTQDVYVRAVYEKDITLTLNLASGAFPEEASPTGFTKSQDEPILYSKSGSSGWTPTKPTTEPVRENYAFEGWFKEDGTEYDFTQQITEDTTIYAKWEYNGYKESITLQKVYNKNAAYLTEEEKTNNEAVTLSEDDIVQEEITLSITPVEGKAFHREAGKASQAVPIFKNDEEDAEDNTFKFTTGTVVNPNAITIPVDFNDAGVGVYWYKIVEQEGRTAGVTYDTNTYYLCLIVSHEDADNPSSSNVSQYAIYQFDSEEKITATSHETAGLSKNLGFTNTYGAGELTICNKTTGNMADVSSPYTVHITFTAPTEKTIKGDIKLGEETMIPAESATQSRSVIANWSTDPQTNKKTATYELTLQPNTEKTITNIPDGVSYKVIEDEGAIENLPTYSFVEEFKEENDTIESDATSQGARSWDANYASGSISNTTDILEISRQKDVTINIGLILENGPFIGILLAAATISAMLLVFKRRRLVSER